MISFSLALKLPYAAIKPLTDIVPFDIQKKAFLKDQKKWNLIHTEDNLLSKKKNKLNNFFFFFTTFFFKALNFVSVKIL